MEGLAILAGSDKIKDNIFKGVVHANLLFIISMF